MGIILIPALVILFGSAMAAGGAKIFEVSFFGLLPLMAGASLAILGAFIALWARLALIYAIKDEKLGAGESYSESWPKFFSYWWIAILTGFLMLAGFFLFVIPAFVFGVWFVFAGFALVFDNQKGLSALVKSREYVRGRWRPVFWRLFLLAAAMGILSSVPVFGQIVAFLAWPFFMVYLYLIFTELKSFRGKAAVTKAVKNKIVILGVLGWLVPVLLITAAAAIILILQFSYPQLLLP